MNRSILLLFIAIALCCSLTACSEAYQPEDIVIYGHYEQNKNLDDGMEPIEWIILNIQGDKMLLVSRYCLDLQPYNIKYENVTWDECSLRVWLNESFISIAFTTEEQTAILLSDIGYNIFDEISFKKYGEFRTIGEKSTYDRIFLLSADEYSHYLNNKAYGIGISTAYASSKSENPYNSDCPYWLRTRDDSSHLIACAIIKWKEKPYKSGRYLHKNDIGVRPAMWVSSKVKFEGKEQKEDTTHKDDLRIGQKFRITSNSGRGRSGPGTEFEIVSFVKEGEVYTILDIAFASNGYEWFLLDMGSTSCWVSSGLGKLN